MSAFLAWPPGAESTFLYFDVVTSESPDMGTQITEHVVEAGPNVSDNVRVALGKYTLEVFVTNEPIDQDSQWSTGTQAPYGLILTPAPSQTPPLPTILTAAEWFTLPIGIPIISALAAHEQDTPFSPNVGLNPTPALLFNPTVLQFSPGFDAVAKTVTQLETLRTTAQLLTIYGSKQTVTNYVIDNWSMTRTAETGTGAEFAIQLKEVRQVSTSLVTVPTVPRAIISVPQGQQATAEANSGQASSVLSQLEQLYSGTTPPSPTP